MLSACSSFLTQESDPRLGIEPEVFNAYEALNRVVRGRNADQYSLEQDLQQLNQDPAYHCRHPAIADFFVTHDLVQRQDEACQSTLPLMISDSRKGNYLLELEPERVREIQILFASNGERIESQFGHVSLRFIVCELKESSDAACAENVLDHIVFGYLAYVDDLELSPVKGVVGGYDANLLATSFMTAYRSNTLLEDRNLSALPLRLTDQERMKWVRLLAEIHWSYRDDYRFFTANCATLLQDFLAVAYHYTDFSLPDRAETLRPDVLFSALRNSELVDAEVLSDLNLAEAKGYYFPSNRGYYQRALDQLRTLDPTADLPASLQAYSQVTASQRLLRLLKSNGIADALKSDERMRSAAQLLEELALLSLQEQQKSWFHQHILAVVDDQDALTNLMSQLSEADQKLIQQCVLSPIEFYRAGRPAHAGVPQQSPDETWLGPNLNRCVEPASRKRTYELASDYLFPTGEMRRSLDALQSEWEQTLKNIQYLKSLG